MKSLIFGAAASALFLSAWCPVLHAQQGRPVVQAHIAVCDTPEQMKALLAKAAAVGDPADQTAAAAGVAAVNAEAGPHACEMSDYAFLVGPDGEVAGEWVLLPLVVIGYVREGEIVPVKPMRAWTAKKVPGEPA